MRRILPALLLLSVLAAPARADFPPPGLWDSFPLDTASRPPANIGAAIAGARALITSRTPGNKQREDTTVGNQVRQGCSLQIGSATLPQGSSNRTIVLQSEVRGSVIQVCR